MSIRSQFYGFSEFDCGHDFKVKYCDKFFHHAGRDARRAAERIRQQELERKKLRDDLSSEVQGLFFNREPDTQRAFNATTDPMSLLLQNLGPNPNINTFFRTAHGQGTPISTPGSLTDDPSQNREDQFADIEGRVSDFFVPNFNQNVGDANREIRFAIARRGLFGGSAETDARARLDDKIVEGREQITSRLNTGQVEKNRLDFSLLDNLLADANAGASSGSVLGGINSSLVANTNAAVDVATSQGLSDVFRNVSTLFKDINDTSQFNTGFNAQLAQLRRGFGTGAGLNPTSSQGTIS